jgi:hypothetical protein
LCGKPLAGESTVLIFISTIVLSNMILCPSLFLRWDTNAQFAAMRLPTTRIPDIRGRSRAKKMLVLL